MLLRAQKPRCPTRHRRSVGLIRFDRKVTLCCDGPQMSSSLVHPSAESCLAPILSFFRSRLHKSRDAVSYICEGCHRVSCPKLDGILKNKLHALNLTIAWKIYIDWINGKLYGDSVIWAIIVKTVRYLDISKWLFKLHSFRRSERISARWFNYLFLLLKSPSSGITVVEISKPLNWTCQRALSIRISRSGKFHALCTLSQVCVIFCFLGPDVDNFTEIDLSYFFSIFSSFLNLSYIFRQNRKIWVHNLRMIEIYPVIIHINIDTVI